MADTKWFFYKKSVMGRWSSQISTIHPKDLLDKSAKILGQPIELKSLDFDLSLRECEAKWPATIMENPALKPTTLEDVEKLITVFPEDIIPNPSIDADKAVAELKARGLYDLVKQKMLGDEL